MNEVSMKRYAGPFESIPFEFYIQLPIGLVPKSGGKTHLIFHLSYNFEQHKSVNFYMPAGSCSVKYRDLDYAIKQILSLIQTISNGNCIIWFTKTDLTSAFRILGMHPSVWWLMVMYAEHPETGNICFFVDKCFPSGHSMSCALFQAFSDALDHILNFIMRQKMVKRQIT